MSTLPSLADALVVVVLLVPGFITVKLFSRIAIFERKLSDFESTVYSLAVSLAIYVPFSFVTGLQNIDTIRDSIFVPSNLGFLLLLSVGSGVLVGVGVRRWARKSYKYGTPLDVLLQKLRKTGERTLFAVIDTEDDTRFIGKFLLTGSGEQPRDIALYEPYQIVSDAAGHATQVSVGKELFVAEENVRRIMFLKDVNEVRADV